MRVLVPIVDDIMGENSEEFLGNSVLTRGSDFDITIAPQRANATTRDNDDNCLVCVYHTVCNSKFHF